MNRFHVHVAVDDLEANIRFYSALFGAEPAVKKADYAKWMLEDPRINFAISQRGHRAGINHLGIQVESDAQLDAMRMRLADAQIAATTPGEAACCYSRSSKYWTTDPQGVAWETYHTLGAIPVFGEDRAALAPKDETTACCIAGQIQPSAKAAPAGATAQAAQCCAQ
jgi:catechol 2,3-dioxygenase-like lactoylglutathione lyase family enzyme